MGDVPPHAGPPNEYPGRETLSGTVPGSGSVEAQNYHPGRGVPDQQGGLLLQAQQTFGSPQHAFSSQFDMTQSQASARAGPYNMAAMMNAPPQANYRTSQYGPGPAQRFNTVGSPPTVVGQMPPATQYTPQAAMAPMTNPQFYLPQQPQMAQYYAPPLSPSQQQGGNLSPRQGPGYYPGQMVMSSQQPPHPTAAYYYQQASHFPGQGQPHMAMQGQPLSGQYLQPAATQTDPRLSQAQSVEQTVKQTSLNKKASGESRSSVVRGPPRKPRQSGHAIWIGNLPPQTDLMSLVHHVCKEASGLESLFLISKSNCAFANFKDEQTCVAAQQKLHDSKFQTVRLVSRLRKSTVEGASGLTAPTGPAASTSAQQLPAAAQEARAEAKKDGNEYEKSPATASPPSTATATATRTAPAATRPARVVGGPGAPQKDRFFILKSLTVEDLESSVRTGVWATQSHNEQLLNSAFQTAQNVYLVFSANKSGEYFGYARMVSPINEDPAAAIEFAPKAQTASDTDLPKAIPTEATQFAPRGCIIDDSARGTIFWEAERDEHFPADGSAPDSEEGGSVGGEADDSGSVKSGQDAGGGGEPKAWGKPFKLEWMSTTRLPFYRTRGLRNPWNSNRDVKIARDGTELEPSVGRRLVALFNRGQRPGSRASGTAGAGRPSGAGTGAGMRQRGVPMVTGYPPVRSPFPQ